MCNKLCVIKINLIFTAMKQQLDETETVINVKDLQKLQEESTTDPIVTSPPSEYGGIQNSTLPRIE